MKTSKLVIPMCMLCCLLVSLIPVSTAFSASDSISDVTGDVVDIEGSIIESSTYLDIEDIDAVDFEYTFTDSTVELVLTVDGQILNRGSFDEINVLYGESEDFLNITTIDIDSALYDFLIETENNLYQVRYVNGEVEVTDAYYELNVTDAVASVSGSSLTISFSLDTADDELVSVQAGSQYLRFDFNLDDLLNMSDDDLYDAMFIALDTVPNSPLEIYYAEAEAYTVEEGEPVMFEGAIVPMTGQPPYTYEWDFGDGSTGTGSNLNHTYTSSGEFTFTLTVTDGAGDSVTESSSLSVVGGSGDSGDDDGSGSNAMLFIGIIAIIVVIGVVAIVFILRR